MRHRISALAALALATGLVSHAAQAALIDRGGGLIYDSDLNVTWLADANYAQTSGYSATGQMDWNTAVTWAANLVYHDSVRNVDYSDWRLPTTTDTGGPGCNGAYSGTDCGFNVDPNSSEMAHLYFVELGNQSQFTITGADSGAYEGGANPISTLDNVGPFTNFRSHYYWSGTEYATDNQYAWTFGTYNGSQANDYKALGYFALAVRPGDVATVPEADTWAMLLAGLGLVGAVARRRRVQR